MIKRTQEWLPFGLNNSNQQERRPTWDVDTGHQKFLTFDRTTFISYTDHVRSIPIQCMMIISQLGRRLTSKNQRPLKIYSEWWQRFAAFIQGFISNIGLLAFFALILDFTFWLNFFRQLITRCTFTHLGLILLERRNLTLGAEARNYAYNFVGTVTSFTAETSTSLVFSVRRLLSDQWLKFLSLNY